MRMDDGYIDGDGRLDGLGGAGSQRMTERQERDLTLGLTSPSSDLPLTGGRLTGGLLTSIGDHRSAQ